MEIFVKNVLMVLIMQLVSLTRYNDIKSKAKCQNEYKSDLNEIKRRKDKSKAKKHIIQY